MENKKFEKKVETDEWMKFINHEDERTKRKKIEEIKPADHNRKMTTCPEDIPQFSFSN